ncbi:MAG: O-antigen ligase family protein [Burkholderiaceae bacterium]|jgi:O-antigen ligase|nr:O-antigen ligase family protein [Burkholderiaceae bacterium]
MLTGLAFTLLFLGLLALALLRHPVFGLYAYLAVFYVHPPSRWWSAMLPDLRWALLAGVVTLLAIYIHRNKLAKAPPWFGVAPAAFLIAYCAWMWVQNFWALDAEVHYAASVQYSKYLVAFYFCYRILDTPGRLRDFLLVHLAGCAYLGVQAYLSSNFAGNRLNGVGGPGIDDANTLGMFLATGVVAGAALALSQSGWRRNVTFVGLALAMNGLVLTASRGAFLGLIGGGGILSALHPRRFRVRFVVLALIALIGFFAVADQRFIERMISLVAVWEQSEEIDSSAQSRFVLKQAQWQMFLDYPMGAGHKGTAALSPLYLAEEWLATSRVGDRVVMARSSHNTFFTTLTEQGIVGALLFIALVLWVLRCALRIMLLRDRLPDPTQPVIAAGLCGGVMVVLVAGIGTDYLMAEVQFWFLAGLACAMRLLAATAAQPRVEQAKGSTSPGGASHAGALQRSRWNA